MRVYLAGYYIGKSAAYSIDDYPYFLESYHYVQSQRFCDEIRKDRRTIFLDSGAFSMHTKGIKVDLRTYADWIERNKDIIHVASNLDIIGQGEELGTWENQQKLEDMGAQIQPVFHVRDNDRWLVKYLEAGYDYIFIGGMVPESVPFLKRRLDQIWKDYLIDRKGMPIVKIHGFGLTVLPLMQRYPWYSVDSTSWILTGRFGSIYVRLRSGIVTKISISGKSPKVKDWDGHYDTLSPPLKKELDSLFEEKGFTAQEMRDIYWKRDLWNIAFFKELCDGPVSPFIPDLGIFDHV